ncbi:predicted protein [Plenodomus lingam JN3]|uniref:Predicted protein n=1 Tax=Leptosphaeria maculans (strain JN3 / isolate v23.1.3 / race Av1-4-5-6-7-8) TaxID=985895 RepID=E5ACF3_LEPMJ|nr:predicted protein [Plenodomus lingam JN3]CBY02155.1 predicted protein [Plenodomus lingam JN3]
MPMLQPTPWPMSPHGYNLSVPTGEHQNGHLPQHSTETQAAANYPYLRRGIVFPYPESAVCATTYPSISALSRDFCSSTMSPSHLAMSPFLPHWLFHYATGRHITYAPVVFSQSHILVLHNAYSLVLLDLIELQPSFNKAMDDSYIDLVTIPPSFCRQIVFNRQKVINEL